MQSAIISTSPLPHVLFSCLGLPSARKKIVVISGAEISVNTPEVFLAGSLVPIELT
jgi:hypothetical protein